VYYTYNYNTRRFSILSGIIFDMSVISHHIMHDVDNFSDYEPDVLQLCPEIKILGVSERVHTPHVSWPKANELDLCKYRSILDLKFAGHHSPYRSSSI